MCQWCAAEGRLKPATHVDHWIPLALGGEPLADKNIVSLCHSCHSRKTLMERRGQPLPVIAPSAERVIALA